MNLPSEVLQLFSVGVLFISVHCAGMCGPIVGGLQLRTPLALLQYQAGRAVTLGALGALAGALGERATHVLARGGPVLALVASVAIGAAALAKVRGRPGVVVIGRRSRLDALWQRALALGMALGEGRAFALGVALGFLPCMIVAWVLGLAASSASPATGALLLVCLVAMTTPTLSIAVLVPRALVARIRSRHLSAALLGVSALWLLLVSGAGFALIEHRHIGVVLFGHNLTVMLF